jgi:rhodanese-related sulfurtransferase
MIFVENLNNQIMGFFSSLFGGGNKVEIKQIIENGAIIIDVRTPGEFAGGHVKGSVNIPLDKIQGNIHKIKDYKKPIVVCCASGMRSSNAKRVLIKNGLEDVYDGGSWMSIG